MTQIFSVEDFEERLSELTIGTKEVQELMEFVRVQDRKLKHQMKKLDVAATMIGHSQIENCLIESDYE